MNLRVLWWPVCVETGAAAGFSCGMQIRISWLNRSRDPTLNWKPREGIWCIFGPVQPTFGLNFRFYAVIRQTLKNHGACKFNLLVLSRLLTYLFTNFEEVSMKTSAKFKINLFQGSGRWYLSFQYIIKLPYECIIWYDSYPFITFWLEYVSTTSFNVWF